MATAQLKPVFQNTDRPQSTRFTAEAEQLAATPSPAILLQQRLHTSTVAQVATGKWPLRARVALIVSASLALWVALLTLAVEIARAIA